jgi:hypothetical protein
MAHDDVPAKRGDRELIADPAPHGSRLHEPQMVRVSSTPMWGKVRWSDGRAVNAQSGAAAAMEDTMVDTTKRNRELVADPSALCPRLCKSQMVGVGRSTSAHLLLC